MLQAIERYMKQAIVDRSPAISSAALVKIYLKEKKNSLQSLKIYFFHRSQVCIWPFPVGAMMWSKDGSMRPKRPCPQTQPWFSTMRLDYCIISGKILQFFAGYTISEFTDYLAKNLKGSPNSAV